MHKKGGTAQTMRKRIHFKVTPNWREIANEKDGVPDIRPKVIWIENAFWHCNNLGYMRGNWKIRIY